MDLESRIKIDIYDYFSTRLIGYMDYIVLHQGSIELATMRSPSSLFHYLFKQSLRFLIIFIHRIKVNTMGEI